MLKSEMHFKRYWPEATDNSSRDVEIARWDFIAGYNAALDEIALRVDDGAKITRKWTDWMKGERW